MLTCEPSLSMFITGVRFLHTQCCVQLHLPFSFVMIIVDIFLGLTGFQLPRVLVTDPIARNYGMSSGHMLVIQSSETAYRLLKKF